jgi:hypothetical protein
VKRRYAQCELVPGGLPAPPRPLSPFVSLQPLPQKALLEPNNAKRGGPRLTTRGVTCRVPTHATSYNRRGREKNQKRESDAC